MAICMGMVEYGDEDKGCDMVGIEVVVCMRLCIRGAISNKRMGDAWDGWREVVREMGLMGLERKGGIHGYGNGCEDGRW